MPDPPACNLALATLPAELATWLATLKGRVTTTTLRSAVPRLCTWTPLTVEQLATQLTKDRHYRGQSQFGLGCVTDDPHWNLLDMQISIREGELHISAEKIDAISAAVPLYDMDQPSTGPDTVAGVGYNNFLRGSKRPHVLVSDQMAVFAQFESAARFEAGHKTAQETIPTVAKRYQNLLPILFLDPVPARMRDYCYTNDKRLLGDGTNLSSVLHRLWGADAHVGTEPFATQRAAILAFIQSLPEQDIAGLGFLDGPRGEVMVQLLETFGGRPMAYDASLLSDGTLRVLAIAAAMLSAPEGSLVVIEEIDNGVHPSRARHLLDSIRLIAERRRLRVLLSTHNPALLDALPDVAVPDVVFCYRDPASGASKLVRMQEIPDLPELLVQGPLGHLMTSGALERFVKTHPGSEARKQKAKAWLATLREAKPGVAG